MGWQTVIVVLATVSLTTAFIHLSPSDKEVIYDWRALVKAGTDLPIPHASQFSLRGKIHLQSNTNSTHVRITDLSYKLYNGILDHDHEHKSHSVPVQLQELHHPFRVVYDQHGLALGIATEEQDKEFSRNIKKAIATILQMDDSVLKPRIHRDTVVIKEHSIYGRFDTDYTIRHGEHEIEVEKLHDMHDAHHLYRNLVSNNEPNECDIGYENALQHQSRRRYFIVKQDNQHIVREIRASGGLIYQPFKAQSDHQYIHVNQTLVLDRMVPIQERVRISTERFEDHLTYHYFIDRSDGSRHDITNGRHISDYEKLMTTVQHMLDDIHQYLHEDHIHTKEPDSKRGQLINRVQRLLQHFPLTKLHELHKKLTGNALDMFHHVLPLVGTRASTLFVKHLVINRVVDDRISTEMLQHLPEHIIEPTIELLTELEELIHLNDNISWNVRRSAILCFSNVIHKSHNFVERQHRNQEYDHHLTHHDDHYDHQQPYEKYVVEFINNLRSSHDYRVKVAYAYGLSNMRLHSIIQHMRPAVNGEWYNDYHFRILSLWALGSSAIVDKDDNIVIETLWPIFTNVDEITEMRLIAFHHLMERRLRESRLMNMYEHLLKEPNPEVYNFVYSHLHSVMESAEPCNEQFRVRVAHLVKLLPPPSHGISHVHIHDYRDVNFGFSQGLHEYFINGQHSLMFALRTTSQHFNIHHEDHTFYLKIHKVPIFGNTLGMIFDHLKRNRVDKTEDVHIEFVVGRHGQIVDSTFINKDNLHELNRILDLFNKDTHSLTEDLVHISYNELHQLVVPTDLGIPAVWEYKMPILHHNNFTVTKETINKVVNIHIDNRYFHWNHYRHGLSFYNPVVDIWQGVNRYHSIDAVWPVRFDLTLSTQNLQLSWRRPSTTHRGIGGMRSHVKQMVFIKDDHNRNLLAQSSPECKDFIIVSHGQQFRNDYMLMHEDDLSTGHRWHVEVYDSSRYVTNGSFNHLFHQFTRSNHRHTDTPLGRLLTTYMNWCQYVRFLPRSGTYGFIVRTEPSHQHPVSNIDLSLRFHSDGTDSNKQKWNTRITYAVKNQEKSIKTWDVNTILDLNSDHSVNNLKMHITRIVPGQRDYKVCVDGVKKWTQKGVEGHMNVAMSQTTDGKCVKDDTVIDVTMVGRHSREQLEGRHKYGSCEVISPYSIPHRHSLQCLVDHSTVRHYVYNVKTSNVPTEFRKTIAHWWDIIKGYYISYYSFEDEHNENIPEHNIRVDLDYPMEEEQVNLHITTPQHVFRLTGVPRHFWKWFGLRPDSLSYPMQFQLLHHLGEMEHCMVETDHIHVNDRRIQDRVPNDWTLYSGDNAQNTQRGVFVKRVGNDELAVRIIDRKHAVEIVPHGANHQITINGQVVAINDYHQEDWGYFHVFNQDTNHPVAVMLPNVGLHVEYQHHEVIIVDHEMTHGRCHSHH